MENTIPCTLAEYYVLSQKKIEKIHLSIDKAGNVCYIYTYLNGRKFERKGECGYEADYFHYCYDAGAVHVFLLHVQNFLCIHFRYVLQIEGKTLCRIVFCDTYSA